MPNQPDPVVDDRGWMTIGVNHARRSVRLVTITIGDRERLFYELSDDDLFRPCTGCGKRSRTLPDCDRCAGTGLGYRVGRLEKAIVLERANWASSQRLAALASVRSTTRLNTGEHWRELHPHLALKLYPLAAGVDPDVNLRLYGYALKVAAGQALTHVETTEAARLLVDHDEERSMMSGRRHAGTVGFPVTMLGVVTSSKPLKYGRAGKPRQVALTIAGSGRDDGVTVATVSATLGACLLRAGDRVEVTGTVVGHDRRGDGLVTVLEKALFAAREEVADDDAEELVGALHEVD
ncbi:hypothetical protein [Amycolatopsis sp. DSM 110486]|uniref:hypothetical protein n=1 Tax=Amycolatopsis sp. DSM 110486 TaxID=2865832 RepID=UPI001C6A38D7|nr:hypothetical protein [Amycolatopsis sp. DSM 110486]QYN17531.1 hypothetical protein K1T34_32620 [Amycolatopsis sp. DSM 110486]